MKTASEKAGAVHLENQPDIQRLLDTMESILSQLRRPMDLAPLKPTRRALRAKAAIGMTGDGKSHFWARQNPKDPAWDPTFPASFKLDDSPRSATVWFEDEIQAWLEARASASRKVVPPGGICRRRKHPSETINSAAKVTP